MAEPLSLEILINSTARGRGIELTDAQLQDLARQMAAAIAAGVPLDRALNQITTRLRAMQTAASSAQKPVQELGGQFAEAGKESEQAASAAGKAVQGLGRDFQDGAVAGNILNQALSGNILALGQLGPWIKTIGTLLKTNMVGALVTLGAVAAQVILPIVQGFLQTKKAAEDTSDAMAVAARSGQKLGEIKLKALQDELNKTRDRADAALASFNAILAADAKLRGAQNETAKAAIEADPRLTATEKLARTNAIDEAEIKAKRSDEDRLRQAEEEATALRAAALKKNADKLQAERDRIGKEEVVNASLAIIERAKAAKELKDATTEEAVQLSSVQTPGQNITAQQVRQLEAAKARQQAAKNALDRLPSELQLNSNFAEAQAALGKVDPAVQQARDEADKAARDLAAEQKKNAEIAKRTEATRRQEDELAAIKRSQAAKQARDQDAAELADVRKQQNDVRARAESAQAAGDFTAQDKAAAEFSQLQQSLKPGLVGADVRKQIADEADRRAFANKQSVNLGQPNPLPRENIPVAPSELANAIAPTEPGSSSQDKAAAIKAAVDAATARQKEAADKSAASVEAASQAITAGAAALPPPLDAKPLQQSNADYHAHVVKLAQASADAIKTVSDEQRSLARELDTLRSQISNMRLYSR